MEKWEIQCKQLNMSTGIIAHTEQSHMDENDSNGHDCFKIWHSAHQTTTQDIQ